MMSTFVYLKNERQVEANAETKIIEATSMSSLDGTVELVFDENNRQRGPGQG